MISASKVVTTVNDVEHCYITAGYETARDMLAQIDTDAKQAARDVLAWIDAKQTDSSSTLGYG